MNEADGQETEPTLKPNEQDARMSSEEKTVTWIALSIPVFMAVSTGVMALILKAMLGHLNRPEVLSSAHFMLIFLVANSLLFICLPIPFFYKMIRRKMRTGSIYPSGDELKARRARRQRQIPLWLSIPFAAVFGIVTVSSVCAALSNPNHRGLYWAFTIIFGVATFQSTWQILHPLAPKTALPAAPGEPQTSPEAERP
ncbi:MAG: hypothetical protein ABSD44_00995 [Terracidiphilus sp.]